MTIRELVSGIFVVRVSITSSIQSAAIALCGRVTGAGRGSAVTMLFLRSGAALLSAKMCDERRHFSRQVLSIENTRETLACMRNAQLAV